MKYKLIILMATLATLFGAISSATYAAGTEPLEVGGSIEVKDTPSQTNLSRSKRSISGDLDAAPLTAPTRGVATRAIDAEATGWGNPFLPGGDGWDTSDTGNVGYPIGDASLPILLSMLLFYFVYRGVSSSKRKSNF